MQSLLGLEREESPMDARQEIVPVELANGVKVHIEATVFGGEEDVAFDLLSFKEGTDTIESISWAVLGAIRKVNPKKAGVEFGLEIAVESGKLTTLLVKGRCGHVPEASRVIFTSLNAMRVPGLLHAPKASRRKVSPSHVATVLWAVRHA